MGNDGAEGLLAMRQAGAWTLAQSEESCVVFGMPAVAIELGAVEQILPVDKIATTITALTMPQRR
jgi:two-component system chemotaxis response regulator CheB